MLEADVSLILASQSPRRAELLANAGYQFSVKAPADETEEQADKNFPPDILVVRLALCKAENVLHQLQRESSASLQQPRSGRREIILAADTVAVCEDEVLGKPRDRNDALRMLKHMGGKEHRVLTGVCLWDPSTNQHLERLGVTILRMDRLSDRELDQFLQTDDWRGKAGGFGYQDGLSWLHIVEGLVSNVVGLPVEELPGWIQQLNEQGSAI